MKIKIRFFAIVIVLMISTLTSGATGKKNPHCISKDSLRESAKEMRNTCREAFDFLSTGRAFPKVDIPEGAYEDAWRFYKSNFVSGERRQSFSSSSNTTWENIGPTNFGGRTLGIAIDPNDTSIIWMGSASGGLWKSTTGGISDWSYIPTGFPVRGVSCIAIDPSNSNVIYIGTGETYSYGSSVNGIVTRPTRGTAGTGILKTTDGGLSWSPSLNWNYNQLSGIWDILINPLNPAVLYAATTEGIYKSTDAGANWQNVFSEQMVMDLELDKTDTNIVYAGVGNINSANKGIYRSTNSGSSWTRLTNGLPANTNKGRIAVTSFHGNTKTLYALIADEYNTIGVYLSTDSGSTWTARNNTSTDIVSYDGWYAKGLCIKPDDASKVLFGGVNVFRSLSTGNSITQVSNVNFNTDLVHQDIHDIVSNPLNPNMVYVLTDGGLFRSNNFGTTFYECNIGYITTQFYCGSSSHQDSLYLLGGTQGNSTARYTGSMYWEPLVGGDGTSNAIDPHNDLNEFCAYPFLNILGTTDRANNFFQSFTSPNSQTGGNPAAYVAPLVICPSDATILYAGTNALLRSADQGVFWTIPHVIAADTGKVILTIAVSSTNVDSLYFATAPSDTTQMHVFRSVNGGVSFTNISAGLPANRYPRKIVVNPSNSRELYIVYSGFGSGHIFRSVNAGTSWTDISSSLPDVPFHTLMIDPAHTNAIYAGSDLGVFASADTGSNWLALNDGLPDGVMVFDLVHSPVDNAAVAFTYGHGAYKFSLGTLTVQVNEQSQIPSFSQVILSNPVHNRIHLDINTADEGSAMIYLYDYTGKKLKDFESGNLTRGANRVHVDISEFCNGAYFLKTEYKGQFRVNKLIILNDGR